MLNGPLATPATNRTGRHIVGTVCSLADSTVDLISESYRGRFGCLCLSAGRFVGSTHSKTCICPVLISNIIETTYKINVAGGGKGA